MAYSNLPKDSGASICVSSGSLLLTKAEAETALHTAITLAGGKAVIDMTGETVSVNDTLTIRAVALGTGASKADILVRGVPFTWGVEDNGDGTFTATATAAITGNDLWVGGATGYWGDLANWSIRVPTKDDTIEFTGDATIFFESTATSSDDTYPVVSQI